MEDVESIASIRHEPKTDFGCSSEAPSFTPIREWRTRSATPTGRRQPNVSFQSMRKKKPTSDIAKSRQSHVGRTPVGPKIAAL